MRTAFDILCVLVCGTAAVTLVIALAEGFRVCATVL